MLPVEVAFISYDPRAQLAIVFLRERPPDDVTAAGETTRADDEREATAPAAEQDRGLLPIWIGLGEAHAIYTKIEGKTAPRPMTHDLLANVLRTLGATVTAVVVHTLEEYVFHGRIELEAHGKRFDIDSRPSDAIALALRTDAPIFVEDRVMDESAIAESDIREIDKSGDSLRDALESLDEDSYVKV